MKKKVEKLKIAYDEMAKLTLPKCKECRIPLSCCELSYCEFTIDYAKSEFDIILSQTSNQQLPLMGQDGCTVSPYLRPTCTLHVCSINSLGLDPQDPNWTKEYFELRERIDLLNLGLIQ